MFCVSDEQGKKFVVTILGCVCIFRLATFRLKSTNVEMYGALARAKSAWNETSQHQSTVLMASCLPALLYNNMLPMACTVVTDHLRLHFVAARPGETLLVAVLHTCILQSAARFYCRHVTWAEPANQRIARTQQARLQRRRLALASSRVHALWFLASVLVAAPGLVYSTVKAVSQADWGKTSQALSTNVRNPSNAVPGFVQVSGFWQWLLDNAVAIGSAMATSFGLDFLASKLSGPTVDSSWLQLLGLLQATIVLP
eukprot:1926259-Amphidinium_carterae.1